MARKKTTVDIDEDLLRAARVLAARTDKKEYEVFEEALRTYLGFDVLQRVHERLEREGVALSEEESLKLAYEELHAMRAEKDEVVEGPTNSGDSHPAPRGGRSRRTRFRRSFSGGHSG